MGGVRTSGPIFVPVSQDLVATIADFVLDLNNSTDEEVNVTVFIDRMRPALYPKTGEELNLVTRDIVLPPYAYTTLTVKPTAFQPGIDRLIVTLIGDIERLIVSGFASDGRGHIEPSTSLRNQDFFMLPDEETWDDTDFDNDHDDEESR